MIHKLFPEAQIIFTWGTNKLRPTSIIIGITLCSSESFRQTIWTKYQIAYIYVKEDQQKTIIDSRPHKT